VTIIAIDGPAGAGKSTVAREVAARLGWLYIDTGAMYRAVALAALREGVDLADASALADVARSADVELSNGRVLLNGEDVTSPIRDDEVTRAVSAVSAHPDVRRALVSLQRSFAESRDVVMEGRDIGSVVFPQADVKVWLTASEEERSRRRLEQLGRPVTNDSLAEMAGSIRARDRSDATRSASPMSRPPDAVEIDSTDSPIARVVDAIVALVPQGTRDG
jgi:CMP/dCMP kinase